MATSHVTGPTWDEVSNRRIETLHYRVKESAYTLVNLARGEDILLRVTSARRTFAEQANLYARGRTVPGKIVTNAKPGQSYHNYGLALDVVEMRDGKTPIWVNPNWARIGEIGKALGFEWGGDWNHPDKPHFEMAFGQPWRELQKRADRGEFDVWL